MSRSYYTTSNSPTAATASHIPRSYSQYHDPTPPTSFHLLSRLVQSMSTISPPALPAGFEARVTPDGRPYYINTATATVSWRHPNIGAEPRWKFSDEPLPPYWRRAPATSPGRNVFCEHLVGVTTWDDPRGADVKEEGLPEGWEAKTDRWGTRYYVDWNNRVTTYVDPRGRE